MLQHISFFFLFSSMRHICSPTGVTDGLVWSHQPFGEMLVQRKNAENCFSGKLDVDASADRSRCTCCSTVWQQRVLLIRQKWSWDRQAGVFLFTLYWIITHNRCIVNLIHLFSYQITDLLVKLTGMMDFLSCTACCR